MAAYWSRHRAIQARCEEEQVGALAAATCSAYSAAEVAASAVAVDTFATYQAIVGRLLTARGNVQIAGEDDGDVSGFQPLLDAKYAQLLTFVGAEFERLRRSDDLVAQVELFRALANYSAVCRVGAISDEVCGAFERESFPDVLDLPRLTAWKDCRADDDPTQLAYLHGGTLATPRDPTRASRSRSRTARHGSGSRCSTASRWSWKTRA